MASNPHTVEEIFKDYSARRIVAIRALTHGTILFFLVFSLSLAFQPLLLQVLHFFPFFFPDVDKLYELYDSGEEL